MITARLYSASRRAWYAGVVMWQALLLLRRDGAK
jgi:hypothetical protein